MKSVRLFHFSIFSLATIMCFGLVANSSAGDKGSEYMRAAKKFAESDIVEQRNCVTCHTIGESGGTVGPILNQIYNRRSEEWLRKWLKDPNAVKPGTKMPNFGFSPTEIDKIISYFKNMKRTFQAEKILQENPDPIVAGKKLFAVNDCQACHRIGDKGRFVGPNLTWIGHRKSEEWESVWLKDPPAYKPGTFMPNFNLSPDEIKALTAYLHSLQGNDNGKSRKWESVTAFFLDARPRERGRLVAERLACWSCHGEKLDEGVKNPNAAPDGYVPPINSAYSDFSDDELRKLILSGSAPNKKDPAGPTPPFVCPSWEKALTDSELNDLMSYLESIVPESEKWEFQ